MSLIQIQLPWTSTLKAQFSDPDSFTAPNKQDFWSDVLNSWLTLKSHHWESVQYAWCGCLLHVDLSTICHILHLSDSLTLVQWLGKVGPTPGGSGMKGMWAEPCRIWAVTTPKTETHHVRVDRGIWRQWAEKSCAFGYLKLVTRALNKVESVMTCHLNMQHFPGINHKYSEQIRLGSLLKITITTFTLRSKIQKTTNVWNWFIKYFNKRIWGGGDFIRCEWETVLQIQNKPCSPSQWEHRSAVQMSWWFALFVCNVMASRGMASICSLRIKEGANEIIILFSYTKNLTTSFLTKPLELCMRGCFKADWSVCCFREYSSWQRSIPRLVLTITQAQVSLGYT